MIVVTGGAGFIGSAIVWKLNNEGRGDIVIVDRLGETSKWKNLVNRTYAEYLHKKDFLNMILADRVPFPVETIIHMGACSSTTERDADYLMENNYRYSRHVAEWAASHDVRFLYASSAATYGDGTRGFSDDNDVTPVLQPINMYGYSKQLFDLWVLRNGLDKRFVGIKFFNVFGPNEYHKGDMRSVVHKAASQIGETGGMKLFRSHRPDFNDGEQLRDFVYVKDCVDVIWWFLRERTISGIFNLGTGRARTWNDLAGAVFSALNKPVHIEYIDMPASIRDQYQYFTEAPLEKLRAAGCPVVFRSLEDAASDYVGTYLAAGEKTLEK
ncbi:MAG: ADP-glyceromanno-heptose 6-epimerase [Deltaproteobacteria bacterium]|nr:ADP-glyceromanno-heptose 6-epimerase [Deltaproteobacteria bacterium]